MPKKLWQESRLNPSFAVVEGNGPSRASPGRKAEKESGEKNSRRKLTEIVMQISVGLFEEREKNQRKFFPSYSLLCSPFDPPFLDRQEKKAFISISRVEGVSFPVLYVGLDSGP